MKDNSANKLFANIISDNFSFAGILMLLLLISMPVPAFSQNKLEKTAFQTAGQWKPVTDVRSDVAMVYGTHDRENMTFEQRVES
jgi:hypothetical protein